MLLRADDLTFPTPPERLFGRPGPLALEVGFGGGRFLRHLAAAHPTWNLLGAELSLSAVSRTIRRLGRAGARHVRLWRGDGAFLVRDVLPPGSLHRLYVHFPDPWPKERHHDRRLLRAPFFRLAASRLAPDGALLFTSDHADYFASALDEARASGFFHVETRPPPEAALGTKYARKWQAQHKTIRHAVFTPTAAPDASFPPRLTRADMHHALLEGPIPRLDRFEKQVHDIDGGHVVFLDAFEAVDGDGFVVRALVKEHDLLQDVLFEVRHAKEGVYVGVSRFGGPVVTKGTAAAVGHLADWLQTQGLALVEALY